MRMMQNLSVTECKASSRGLIVSASVTWSALIQQVHRFDFLRLVTFSKVSEKEIQVERNRLDLV